MGRHEIRAESQDLGNHTSAAIETSHALCARQRLTVDRDCRCSAQSHVYFDFRFRASPAALRKKFQLHAHARVSTAFLCLTPTGHERVRSGIVAKTPNPKGPASNRNGHENRMRVAVIGTRRWITGHYARKHLGGRHAWTSKHDYDCCRYPVIDFVQHVFPL